MCVCVCGCGGERGGGLLVSPNFAGLSFWVSTKVLPPPPSSRTTSAQWPYIGEHTCTVSRPYKPLFLPFHSRVLCFQPSSPKIPPTHACRDHHTLPTPTQHRNHSCAHIYPLTRLETQCTHSFTPASVQILGFHHAHDGGRQQAIRAVPPGSDQQGSFAMDVRTCSLQTGVCATPRSKFGGRP
jgi:hypothetical protein